MEIVNALQLEAARRCAVPIHFNFVSLSVAMLEHFYCLYVMLYCVTLNFDPVTFDLEHL